MGKLLRDLFFDFFELSEIIPALAPLSYRGKKKCKITVIID